MKKILIIEDEELLRANTVQILKFEDFSTIEANNGCTGIQLAKEYLPDLILCDVMMPQIDGYGVLAALRQNPATATIPFIFTTAKASKADLRQGMELGADDYLTKPFSADELLNAISTRLEKQAAISQLYTTELKQAEEKLNYLSRYDSLTNLPNQFLLRERLERLLIQADDDERLLPVFVVSLEQFNQINSNLGQYFGDLLLKTVAERLIACLEKKHTIARLQAEHFAIILEPVKQKEEIITIAQTILSNLSQPFALEDYEAFVTTSIGIAVYPSDGRNLNNLVKNANIAMCFARERKASNYQFYDRNIDIGFSHQMSLDAKLHYALEREEFQVYYQPQVEIQTGRIIGAEALLRWQQPELGLIPPAEFIPIAEENGLIIPISEWVLMTACKQTKLWQLAGFSTLRIAVNLSGRHISQQNFGQKLARILKETDFDPKCLELELTESVLIKHSEIVNSILIDLQSLGVQVAIDDFGTGYSSLSYLKKFSFNTLKIDRCFVNGLVEDSKNAAITIAIIQMAHAMNLKVIAEGVETEAELSLLRQKQCDEFQGYLFSRPLPAIEFERLLTSEQILQFPLSNN